MWKKIAIISALTLVALVALGAGLVKYTMFPNVTYSATSGPAPLTVCVEGPAHIRRLFETCTYEMVSNGWGGTIGNNHNMRIDWGDGAYYDYTDQSLIGKSCAARRCNTFTAPGEYHVRLDRVKPHSTDVVEGMWESEATITVTGAPHASSLRILSPVTPQSLSYDKFSLPSVE